MHSTITENMASTQARGSKGFLATAWAPAMVATKMSMPPSTLGSTEVEVALKDRSGLSST